MKSNKKIISSILFILSLVSTNIFPMAAIPPAIPINIDGDSKIIFIPTVIPGLPFNLTAVLVMEEGASIGLADIPGVNKIPIPPGLKGKLNKIRFKNLQAGGTLQLIIIRGIADFFGYEVPVQIRIAKKGLSKVAEEQALTQIFTPRQKEGELILDPYGLPIPETDEDGQLIPDMENGEIILNSQTGDPIPLLKDGEPVLDEEGYLQVGKYKVKRYAGIELKPEPILDKEGKVTGHQSPTVKSQWGFTPTRGGQQAAWFNFNDPSQTYVEMIKAGSIKGMMLRESKFTEKAAELGAIETVVEGDIPELIEEEIRKDIRQQKKDLIEKLRKEATEKGETISGKELNERAEAAIQAKRTKAAAAAVAQMKMDEKTSALVKKVKGVKQKIKQAGAGFKKSIGDLIKGYDYSVMISLPIGLKLSDLYKGFKPVDTEITHGMLGFSTGSYEDAEWGALGKGLSFGANIKMLGIMKKLLNKVGTNLNELRVSGSIMPGWVGTSFNIKIPGHLSLDKDVETTGMVFSIRLVEMGVGPASIIGPAVVIGTGLKLNLSEPIIMRAEIEAALTSASINGWMDGMIRLPGLPIKIGEFAAKGEVYYDTAQTVIGAGGLGFAGAIQVGAKRLDIAFFLAAKKQMISGAFTGGLFLSDIVSLAGDIVHGNLAERLGEIKLPEDIAKEEQRIGGIVAETKQAEEAFRWALANPEEADFDYILEIVEQGFTEAGLNEDETEKKIKDVIAEIKEPGSTKKMPKPKRNDWGEEMLKKVPDIGISCASLQYASGAIKLGDKWYYPGLDAMGVGLFFGKKFRLSVFKSEGVLRASGKLEKINLRIPGTPDSVPSIIVIDSTGKKWSAKGGVTTLAKEIEDKTASINLVLKQLENTKLTEKQRAGLEKKHKKLVDELSAFKEEQEAKSYLEQLQEALKSAQKDKKDAVKGGASPIEIAEYNQKIDKINAAIKDHRRSCDSELEDGAEFIFEMTYPEDGVAGLAKLAKAKEVLMNGLGFKAYIDAKVKLPYFGIEQKALIDVGPTSAKIYLESSLQGIFNVIVQTRLDLKDPLEAFLEVDFEQKALSKLSNELMKAAKAYEKEVKAAIQKVGTAQQDAKKALMKAKKDAAAALKKARDHASGELKKANDALKSANRHLQGKKDGLSRDQRGLKASEGRIRNFKEKLAKCAGKVSKVEMAKVTKIVEEKVKAQGEPELKRTPFARRGFPSIFRRLKDRLAVRKRRIADAEKKLKAALRAK